MSRESPLGFIDTHCHLDTHVYADGPDEVLSRATAAGVTGFVAIGVAETLAAAREVAALTERREDVWAAVGMHPHDASAFDDAMETELRALLARPRVVALGEIGLDYHYMHSPKEVQLALFRRLIQVARETKKPIVVHTREAAEDTLRVLEEEDAHDVGGIIHCFSEDLAFATRAFDLDFDVSFSGIVTFKSSLAIQEVARVAPLDRILVETDSPYLAPIPFRGKKCEPAHVVHTAARIAELRGITVDALASATTENAKRRLALS